MAESVEQTEEKLTKLGEKVRAGWAELHAAKQEHRDAVQRALLEQMRQQQEAGQHHLEQQKPKQVETKSTDQKVEQKPAQTEVKPAEQKDEQQRHRHGH